MYFYSLHGESGKIETTLSLRMKTAMFMKPQVTFNSKQLKPMKHSNLIILLANSYTSILNEFCLLQVQSNLTVMDAQRATLVQLGMEAFSRMREKCGYMDFMGDWRKLLDWKQSFGEYIGALPSYWRKECETLLLKLIRCK
ncbi:unnamed protein product [Camellia sinensis]